MTELTRRSFVFGSSAALATAAFDVPNLLLPRATPVQAVARYRFREIQELTAGFLPYMGPDAAATLELQTRGQTFYHAVLNTRSFLHWLGHPYYSLFLRSQDTFTLSLDSPVGIGQVDLTCVDEMEDGTRIAQLERHIFPPFRPPELIPLRA